MAKALCAACTTHTKCSRYSKSIANLMNEAAAPLREVLVVLKRFYLAN